MPRRMEIAAATRRATLVFGAPPEDDAEIERYSSAWQSVAQRVDPGPLNQGMRLQVDAARDESRLLEVALRAERVQSAFLADRSMWPSGEFHWPLRVVFKHDGALFHESSLYRTELGLLTVSELADPETTTDLFVIEGMPSRSDRIVRAGATIILVDDPTSVSEAAAEESSDLTTSFMAIGVTPNDPNEFVRTLFDAFSHNFTPDRAMSDAMRREGPTLMYGHPTYVERARVTSAVARLQFEVEDAHIAKHLAPDRLSDALGPLRHLSYLGDEGYLAESGGATDSSQAMKTTQAILEEDVPHSLDGADHVESTSRHLQAQVFARTPGLTQRLHSFVPEAKHKIAVRIGPTSLDWTSVPSEFPDHRLPADELQHELTVHLIAPGLIGGDEKKQVSLGQTGASGIAEFEVEVVPETSEVAATVIVYRATTHLQTAVLRAPVAEVDEPVSGASLTFSLGDASAVDLELHQDADLSFRLAGDLVRVVDKEGETSDHELPGLSDAMGPLRAQLFDTAVRLEELQQPLSSKNGTKLIVTLALQGEFLRRRFFGDTPPEASTVEVTSPSSGAFLPVEFFYDYPKPNEDAKLCGEFERSDTPACPSCQALEDASFVCPSGFWALSKVIERQIRSTSARDCVDAREPTMDNDVLPPTREVIFAASDKVNTDSDAERVTNTISHIISIGTDVQVHVAKTWNEWKQHINQHHPALLVALPHNVRKDAGFEALSIGAEEDHIELPINDIRPVHVGPSHQRPGPVMLLLGCDVANPAVEYQDFIRQIRCNGAVIVVGTMTSVLGQQAAPFATALVDALWANQGGLTFGELLRRVRADMLRNDNPMALAVTAFGAADWKF